MELRVSAAVKADGYDWGGGMCRETADGEQAGSKRTNERDAPFAISA